MPREIRSSKAQGTYYIAFETRREQKAGLGDGQIDDYIGESPLFRLPNAYITYADLDASFQAKIRLPAGVITTGRFYVLICEAFNGTAAGTASTLGDEVDPDGYFAATELDMTSSAGTVIGPYGATAALANTPYRHDAGGYIVLTVGTAASTAGKCIIFCEALSYNEALDAEENLS